MHAQRFRRQGDVAFAGVQRGEGDDVAMIARPRRGRGGSRRELAQLTQLAGTDERAVRHHVQSLQNAAQLADVARPVLPAEHAHRRVVQLERLPPDLPGDLGVSSRTRSGS